MNYAEIAENKRFLPLWKMPSSARHFSGKGNIRRSGLEAIEATHQILSLCSGKVKSDEDY